MLFIRYSNQKREGGLSRFESSAAGRKKNKFAFRQPHQEKNGQFMPSLTIVRQFGS
jgi:hypothetical protein